VLRMHQLILLFLSPQVVSGLVSGHAGVT